MNPSVRAYRILNPLQSYEAYSSAGAEERFPVPKDGEEFLGIYRNDLNFPGSNVLFSSDGIYIGRERDGEVWEFVSYSQIQSVDLPAGAKPTHLMLGLCDGRCVLMTIAGVTKGRFFDSLEVLRFLDRVVLDFRNAADTGKL